MSPTYCHKIKVMQLTLRLWKTTHDAVTELECHASIIYWGKNWYMSHLLQVTNYVCLSVCLAVVGVCLSVMRGWVC